MSTGRYYTSGILLPDNKTFLVTGGSYNNELEGRLTSCEKLDIATNTWSTAGNLLSPRHGHASVLFNNSAVVLGGYNNVGYLNPCEQFHSASNTWSSFPSFSIARESFGAAVVLNKIYIVGGHNGTSSLSSVEVCSGTSWSPLSPSLAQTRWQSAAVSFQNKLVILGGSQTTIEVFDPITSTWNTTFSPMKIYPSRFYLAAVSF